jgi:hypothetical protein
LDLWLIEALGGDAASLLAMLGASELGLMSMYL